MRMTTIALQIFYYYLLFIIIYYLLFIIYYYWTSLPTVTCPWSHSTWRLYLSNPQANGIEMVLQRIFPTSPPQSIQNAQKNFARDLMRVVIRDNTFRLYNWARCAPPFANLFLASLEEQALSAWTGTHPLLWLWLLDDVLMLWSGTTDELSTFLQHLNSRMASTKFTMEKSQESVTFLDLEIYKGHRFQATGVLDIKPFVKATNPQAFLLFESCHPRFIFPTIVRGEIIRVLRASSDAEIFSIAVSKLLNRFQQRGYPKPLLMEVASSISFCHRPHYLIPQPKRTLEPNTTIFSAPFHPAIDTHSILEAILDSDTPFLPMVTRPRPLLAQDLLVRAKLPEELTS